MIRKGFTVGLIVATFGFLGVAQSGRAADGPAVVAGSCPDACCSKVCRPTVDTKKVSKRVYDDLCEDFCLPKCTLCGHFFGHKGCCDGHGCDTCAKCEKPRTKKYLLVKIRHHEECVNKCVVEYECRPAPAPCPAPCVQAGPGMPPPAPQGARSFGNQPMMQAWPGMVPPTSQGALPVGNQPLPMPMKK